MPVSPLTWNRPILPLSDNVFGVQPLAANTDEPEIKDFVVLGVGAGLVRGVLPSAALALRLQAATPNRPVSLRLAATLLWPQQRTLAEGSIEARGYELSLELCASGRMPGWQRLELRLCAGRRVGVEQARGHDFPMYNANRLNLIAYLGVAPEVALQLASETWLQLGAGGALAIVRPHFLLGIDSERRSIELSNPAVVRGELGRVFKLPTEQLEAISRQVPRKKRRNSGALSSIFAGKLA